MTCRDQVRRSYTQQLLRTELLLLVFPGVTLFAILVLLHSNSAYEVKAVSWFRKKKWRLAWIKQMEKLIKGSNMVGSFLPNFGRESSAQCWIVH